VNDDLEANHGSSVYTCIPNQYLLFSLAHLLACFPVTKKYKGKVNRFGKWFDTNNRIKDAQLLHLK
jgi:hypothetical protein